MNSTCVALIPRNSSTDDLEDFDSISLFNFVYKIISKILTNKINPSLSRGLSVEQFGFLENHHILEVVGMAQEVFHSVKTISLSAGVLQIGLNKSYDRVSWGFLNNWFSL